MDEGNAHQNVQLLWTWVAENLSMLSTPEGLAALQEMAIRVDPDLSITYGQSDGQGGEHQLYISPSGFHEILPLAEYVADQAPEMEGWSVHVGLPRLQTLPPQIMVDDVCMNVDDFKFCLDQYRALVTIKVGVPLDSRVSEEALEVAVLTLLDGLVGEKELLMCAGEITLCSDVQIQDNYCFAEDVAASFDLIVAGIRDELASHKSLDSEVLSERIFSQHRAQLAYQMGECMKVAEEQGTKSSVCELVFIGDSLEDAQAVQEILRRSVGGLTQIATSRTVLGPTHTVSSSFQLGMNLDRQLFELVQDVTKASAEHRFELCDVQIMPM